MTFSTAYIREAPGSRPAIVNRLLAGPSWVRGYESLDHHHDRLGLCPAGGDELLDELARSGLRGRGGGAFPTWRKWVAVAERARAGSVVVINASEGEPLSQKDQTLLSFRPHLVLDGAAIAADSLGAEEIVVYFSRRPGNARRTVEAALKERARAGLPEPPIRLVSTAHRYIAGESSAVVNRSSGGPSKPTFSLRRSTARGVRGRSTLVQNVETLAHVGLIARYGAGWFRQLGSEFSPGSALVTLCGNVCRPGLYEVDLSAPLGAVLEAAGGTPTPPGGALLGGYFGTWLAAGALNDLPLDAERLRSLHGASLGCGVVAVLSQKACGIVEAARIAAYLSHESAGQCGPCVHGLAALSETIERVARSDAEPADLDRIERWMGMVQGRGACHHPDGAVAQLSSALSAFQSHLREHLDGRRCAGLAASDFPRPPHTEKGWR